MAARGSESLGHLGVLVAALPPHARAFLRQAVAMTAAASIGRVDQKLILRAIDKTFDAIEAEGQVGESQQVRDDERQAWLRRQLEGLDGGA